MVKKKTEESEEKQDLTKIKEELTDYVNIQIKKNFTNEVEKAHNKLIREKNHKIFFKNILILILIIIIGFLLYLLYNENYFDKYFNHNKAQETTNNLEKVTTTIKATTEKTKEPTLEELKEEYAYLLDDIIINENSPYIKDYYNGNLTNELKNYLSLNMLNFNNLVVEDECNIINEETLKSEYEKLFNTDYTSNSFDYNGTKVRYIKKLEAYITDNIILNSASHIEREIIDIKEKDKNITISTVEGLVKDNKLYNVMTTKEIKNYKNESLSKYQTKLNKITYTFNDGKLINLEK